MAIFTNTACAYWNDIYRVRLGYSEAEETITGEKQTSKRKTYHLRRPGEPFYTKRFRISVRSS